MTAADNRYGAQEVPCGELVEDFDDVLYAIPEDCRNHSKDERLEADKTRDWFETDF